MLDQLEPGRERECGRSTGELRSQEDLVQTPGSMLSLGKVVLVSPLMSRAPAGARRVLSSSLPGNIPSSLWSSICCLVAFLA